MTHETTTAPQATTTAAVPMLELRNVIKTYGVGATEVRALDNVSIRVAPGEFVAVMGPSGCGKSTLLHLGGGLETATAGQVLVNGADLGSMSAHELAQLRRQTVGFVFQSLNLIPALTAVENVMLPLELDGVESSAARKIATTTLSSVGIDQQIERYPDSFSGGQQQRIAIARSIVGDRRLILADEPTGALDTATSDQVVELLAQLAAAGTSVVMVTHEPRFASWADRVVFLRDGQIVDQTVSAMAGLSHGAAT